MSITIDQIRETSIRLKSEILTAQEAAEFLKISTKLLYKLINRGEIPAKKVGNGFRIRRAALEVYMNQDFDTLGETNV